MPVLSVPGFEGDFFVNPDTGQAWRRGREGGIRHPATGKKGATMDYRQVSPEFARAAQAEIDLFMRATGQGEEGGGFEFEMPDFSELLKPSEEEMKLLNLQISQIEEFMKIQSEIQGRENSRRDAYNRYLTGGAFTPANMEEQQGILAARSAAIAEIEQTRLKDALEGKLPVSPSTERAIKEGATMLAERNLRDLGPLGATSTPGIERQAAFDESAEILKDVDRKGFIERGIRPSIDAASFAMQQIGEYVPGEIPGAATALGGLRQNRQAAATLSLNAAELGLRAAAMEASAGGGDAGAANALGLSSAYQSQYRNAQASSGGGALGGALGSGLGSIAGAVGGALLGGAWNFGLGAPAGAAIGAGIGGSLGGMGGGALGSGLSGGSYMPSMYGMGGGFPTTPYAAAGASRMPRYGGWNTGSPAWG
jgi:hypothetical protein